MRRGGGVDLSLGGDGAGVGELAVELAVELGAVRHHHERPRAGNTTQHLLGEPQHRQALAGPLRVPEHPQALLPRRPHPPKVLDRRVHPEDLMVPRDDLDQATGALSAEPEPEPAAEPTDATNGTTPCVDATDTATTRPIDPVEEAAKAADALARIR